MKRITCMILSLLLVLSMGTTAFAAEFEIDPHAAVDGMSLSWYQGYKPSISNNTMTLFLPVRTVSCVGNINASISLDDPHVFLLAAQPKEVTVSPRDGIYPVKLTLSLQQKRRNGDYPATITLKGYNASGKELVETIPYVIRIRDGYSSHETMEPIISDTIGDLNVGSVGTFNLTISNPTTTQSITDGEITVTDNSGDIIMLGTNRVKIAEILPGKSERVTIPISVKGHASISLHTLEVNFRYRVLGSKAESKETFTVPVTQEIRLEQGGVQFPSAICGELTNMTVPLMNMGRGELCNVLVKLEMNGVLDAQSVLVGTMAAGETKQAKLTFTPKLDSVGTHSGTVTITCEDAYGNSFSQVLDVVLTVEEPIPEEQIQLEEEKEKMRPGTIVLIALCAIMAVGLVVQSILLTQKIHTLEEERL